MTPFLLLGGILTGIYTPTEAAAVAAVYALFASILIQLDVWKRFIADTRHAYLHIAPLSVFLFMGFLGVFDIKAYAIATGSWIIGVEIVWRLVTRSRSRPTAALDKRDLASDVTSAFMETTRRIPDVLRNTAVQSGVILLLVGAAVTFGWMVTVSGLAREATRIILFITDNPLLILLLINLLLFIVGMFLDAGPAILILGPVLAPIMASIGIDPLHFAIVMCVNVTVGLATPPMGLVLFVASSVSGERLENIVREIWPFLLIEFAVIFLITYFPSLTMTIPALAGFARCPEAAVVCQALVGG